MALLARRLDRLEGAAREAGDQAVGIACDVTDESQCHDAITAALEYLGGLDVLIYSAGMGLIEPVEHINATTWQTTLNTNVIGAAVVTSAVLPYLVESGGRAIYLSSVSASLGRPWPGMGSYIVSKAALDRLVDVYRVEHPQVAFTRIVVGDCAGGEGHGMTEMANHWDMEHAGHFMPIWQDRGYFTGSLMPVEELLGGVDFLMRTRAAVQTIWLAPRQLGEADIDDAVQGLRENAAG